MADGPVKPTPGDELQAFYDAKAEYIAKLAADGGLQADAMDLNARLFRHRYMYHFSVLGRPIIQYPADIVAVQELVWAVKPDLIIETGIAHGGSLINSAQMLALLDVCDGTVAPVEGRPARRVLGIDIDIRAHNRDLIEAHPLARYIDMLEGSSIADDMIQAVQERAAGADTVLVFLDSNHTHDHVVAELQAYAPLTTVGSYCVVFDTVIEDLPDGFFDDRPWTKGNSPKSAVAAFLDDGRNGGPGQDFVLDEEYNAKLVLSASIGGFLRRVS